MITLSSSSFLQSSLLHIFTQGEWQCFIIMSMKFLALVERYAKIEDTGYLWEMNRPSAFVAYHHYLPPVVLSVRCLTFGKNNVCWGFVVCVLHYLEEGSFYAYFLQSFYHKWVLNFVKSFLWIYWGDCYALVAQLCLTFWTISDPMNCSPPGSTVHGDSPHKNTGVGCHPFSMGSSQIRDQTQVSHIARGFFTDWATREAHWDDYTFISLSWLIWCITLIDLHILKNPWIPGIKLTWWWCMIFLMCCWIQLAKILLRIFASMFISDTGL